MKEQVIGFLTLAHKIPEYQQRAEYLRQRAILGSIKDGFFIDKEQGRDLIDVTETTAVTLPNNQKIEFAIDSDGICFARIEGGKYYPINTEPSKRLLKQSEQYRKLAKSAIRRIINEPFERRFGRSLFSIQQSMYGISDIVFKLYLALEQLAPTLNRLNQSLNNSKFSEDPLKLLPAGLETNQQSSNVD